MIIPTPEFDPMFADDGQPFRAKMIEYIQREFGSMLGDQGSLLQTPAGLDMLAQAVAVRIDGTVQQRAA